MEKRMNPNQDKRMDSVEAAAYLGISVRLLWEWRNRIRTPVTCYRIGQRKMMYLQSDLDSYLNQCRISLSAEREGSA